MPKWLERHGFNLIIILLMGIMTSIIVAIILNDPGMLNK